MRNVLLTFALLLTFGLSFGQIKVVTTGDTGIGTSTPTEQLHVDGNTLVENGNVLMNNSSSQANVIGGVGGAQRMRITSNIDVINARSFFTMWGDETHTDSPLPARAGELAVQCAYYQIAANKPLGGFASPSFEVNNAGNTQAYGSMTATSYITASDKKLKTGITPLTRGLDEIMQLETKEFYYDSPIFNKSNNDTKQFGLLAQDLQEIVPEAVSKSKYNDWNNGVHEEFLAIDMNKITFMLVNAVQEQQVQIETKDAQIDVLTERLAALETAVLNLSNGTTTQNVEIRDSRLGQNTPNPFTQATIINYVVPTKAQTAVMQVFDMNGQLLKSVNVANGNGQLTINAGELAAGTYSYNLVVDGAIIDTKKMVLTK